MNKTKDKNLMLIEERIEHFKEYIKDAVRKNDNNKLIYGAWRLTYWKERKERL